MDVYLFYSLKVGLLLMVMHLFFRLLMRNAAPALGRTVLLGSMALALVLPLCIVTIHKTMPAPLTLQQPILVSGQPATIDQQPAYIDQATQVLGAVLIAGTLVGLIYINNVYRRLRRTIKHSEQHRMEDGVTLAVVDQPVTPFSWMRTIVLSRIDYEERNPSILAHERCHIRLHHSLDVVFVELLTALQWFNPVVWLMRRDLRAIHEYQADAAVLSSGSDKSLYIQLLMQKATGIKAFALANGINNSMTKKRIIRMLNPKNTPHAWLRALYVIPVVATSLVLNARTVVDYQPVDNASGMQQHVGQTQTPASDDKPNSHAATSSKNKFEITGLSQKDNGKHPLVFINDKEIAYDNLVSISPNIIKHIYVLKEDAATKQYGPRAKDGAILVTIEDHPNKPGHEPFTLRGKVVDENQKPVIGAVIRILGTKQGSVSDMDGAFSINTTDGAIIEAGYVGMQSATIKADRATMAPSNGSAPIITMVLKDDGSADQPVREYHGHVTYNTDKPEVVCVVDGQTMTTEEMMQSLKPELIESMTVDKSNPKQGKIIIKTKKQAQ